MRNYAKGTHLSAAVLTALMVTGALAAGCTADEGVRVVLGSETIAVEVVDDDASRSQGLQDHEPLADGEGMLFVWDDAQVRTFAMKEVTFPIDVVFIGEDFRVSLIAPLEPGDTDLASSPTASQYVLELPAGWAAEHGVEVGSPFVPPPGG